MKTRLHSVLNLALLLASVGIGTYWVLQITSDRTPEVPIVPVPAPSAPRSAPVDTSSAARLFGSATGVAPAGPARISLIGVISEGGRGSGVALLDVNGRNAQTFRVGDAIGTSRSILMEVRADRVLLRTGERVEEIALPVKPVAEGIERSR